MHKRVRLATAPPLLRLLLLPMLMIMVVVPGTTYRILTFPIVPAGSRPARGRLLAVCLRATASEPPLKPPEAGDTNHHPASKSTVLISAARSQPHQHQTPTSG
ncbi:hypothetical protein PLESTM_001174700 [Pleodorina starrii]|nr:hypothetical protein PLESTM_001174700 [Pleodorina starrii]